MSKLPASNRVTYEDRTRIVWQFIIRSAKKCRGCRKESEDIGAFEADHVIKRSRSRSLSVNLLNGACMCIPCHRRKHGKDPDAWIQEMHSDRLPELERLSRVVDPAFSWAVAYEDLWAELVKRGLEPSFRAYLHDRPSIAKLWR